jgi:hypothetical protein
MANRKTSRAGTEFQAWASVVSTAQMEEIRVSGLET